MSRRRAPLPVRDLHGPTPPNRPGTAAHPQSNPSPPGRLSPRYRGPVPAVPDLDLASIRQFCDGRVPAHLRDEARVEADVRGKSVTIFDCRPPWHPNLTDWSRVPVAQLRYDPANHAWTLYWARSRRCSPALLSGSPLTCVVTESHSVERQRHARRPRDEDQAAPEHELLPRTNNRLGPSGAGLRRFEIQPRALLYSGA